ncbi:unnamed protein product [Candida parapsilosis]
MSSTDKINTQSEQRGAATASGYGTDNKTTLPPLGSTMKTEQPESYTQTQQQQPYEYNVQPSIYSSYQQSNYDPYQRQSSLQPQNAYAGMTQYTQQAYPSTNASGAVRFSYSGNSASAVPASTSKQDLHTHVPPEKKSRRFRRRYNQIVRKYPCSFPGCNNHKCSYLHNNTLHNQTITVGTIMAISLHPTYVQMFRMIHRWYRSSAPGCITWVYSPHQL